MFESTNEFLPDDRVALDELANVRDNLLSSLYFLYVTCWLLSAHLKAGHWKIRFKISLHVPSWIFVCLLFVYNEWENRFFVLEL